MDYNKSKFGKQSKDYRISAVISDGQWYTKDKWAKVAKVKEEDIEEWLENNQDTIIISEHGSIRRSGKHCIEWYESMGIPLEAEIIPNNYPVRIVNGKTETEYFEDNPSIYISTVNVTYEEIPLLQKIKNAVRGCGYINEEEGEVIISCLEPRYVRDRIKMSLTAKEEEKITIRTRQGYRRRDISRFDSDFLVYMYDFYLPYCKNILKGHRQTLDMFLPTKEDENMQILEWLYKAMERFDETVSTPFSGYLAGVLRFWPYDLPDTSMGKEISQFQREKRKLLEKLGHTTDKEHTDEELAEMLGRTVEDYRRLSMEYAQWESMNKASDSITSLSQKSVEEKNIQRLEQSNKISRVVLEIIRDHGMLEDSRKILSAIEEGSEDMSVIADLSEEYKLLFAEYYNRR